MVEPLKENLVNLLLEGIHHDRIGEASMNVTKVIRGVIDSFVSVEEYKRKGKLEVSVFRFWLPFMKTRPLYWVWLNWVHKTGEWMSVWKDWALVLDIHMVGKVSRDGVGTSLCWFDHSNLLIGHDILVSVESYSCWWDSLVNNSVRMQEAPQYHSWRLYWHILLRIVLINA